MKATTDISTTSIPSLTPHSHRSHRRTSTALYYLIVIVTMLQFAKTTFAFSRTLPVLHHGSRALMIPSLHRGLSSAADSTIPLESAEIPTISPEVIMNNGFSKLGLTGDLVKALLDQNIDKPTPVQAEVIGRLLNRENLVMAASTGSGKTLAYTLPAIQQMRTEEMLGYNRLPQRPRCLILVPTRELARQVLQSIKRIGHVSKVASCAVIGGEQYALQKAGLNRVVDIVVASPGRLMQHKQQGNVFLSHVNTLIIDEVDTMLTQGFGSDIRGILRSVLRKRDNVDDAHDSTTHLVMATATLTKAVRTLLADVENGGFAVDFSDPSNPTPKKLDGNEQRVKLNVVEVDGVHRTLPHVKHNFEETKGQDKLLVLKNLIDRNDKKMKSTMIFCNTIDSCRAVEYAIKEDTNIEAACYHGDLNSRERESNLKKFRDGESSYLVCTDIAARGLDIPDIDHIIMFDFPMNPVDYIHRAGRCGRAGRKGSVTSIIAKRDEVLSLAIQGAIKQGLPIDSLSASKRDYESNGRLAHVVGRKPTASTGKPLRRRSEIPSTPRGDSKSRSPYSPESSRRFSAPSPARGGRGRPESSSPSRGDRGSFRPESSSPSRGDRGSFRAESSSPARGDRESFRPESSSPARGGRGSFRPGSSSGRGDRTSFRSESSAPARGGRGSFRSETSSSAPPRSGRGRSESFSSEEPSRGGRGSSRPESSSGRGDRSSFRSESSGPSRGGGRGSFRPESSSKPRSFSRR